MSVILINTFEVPEELMDKHQEAWGNHTKALLETKEFGLISVKFHKAIDLKNKYQFVNVAEGGTYWTFQKMINVERLRKDTASRIIFNPGLFEIVSEAKA